MKKQGKIEGNEQTERKVFAVKPASEIFEIPVDKVKNGSILYFRNHREVVSEVFPEIYLRALGRQSNNAIYIATYKLIQFKNTFYRFTSPSVKGLSKDYKSLDKRLKEAGL